MGDEQGGKALGHATNVGGVEHLKNRDDFDHLIQ